MSGAGPAFAPGAILDHPLLSQRYFFPRPGRVPSPLLVDAGDATLACSFHEPHPGALTAVHFHGNGEIAADYLGGFPERFASLGMNLLLAEYRGYGSSTGEPLLGKMLDDVPAIVRAARVPPGRIVLFGRSVGSIFALEAVARFPEAAGLVIESGVASPLERLLMRVDPREVGATPEAFARAFEERLDHERKIGAFRGPTLLLHCANDGLVDAGNAERLATWAGGPVELRLFERGDHNTILAENEEEYFEAVAALAALAEARA